MVEIFGRCSRLLNKITLNAGDDFFSRLCTKESDKLLSAFIFFLRGEESARSNTERYEHRIAQSGVLRQQVVAKPGNIVQRYPSVAQSGGRLISQIKNILNLLEILKHLGLAKPPTSLLLERDLLLLELSVLEVCRPAETFPVKTEESAALEVKTSTKARKSNPRSLLALGRLHKEILELIKSKERIQNLEIFSHFAHITRRTLKRKLSNLTKAGIIKRSAKAKKVFYTVL